MTDEQREQPVRSPWLKPPQAAAYLGVSLGTLRNWTSMQYIPFARRGRVARYHVGELDRWLTGGRVKDARR
jgi:excisionase family DNA binding protein